MQIRSTRKENCIQACTREEFKAPQGSDYVAGQDDETDSGADMGNFRAKSVLFGVGMEALSNSVDEVISLREQESQGTVRESRWRDMTKIFKPRLEFATDADGNPEVSANTIGDTVESSRTFHIPKKDAVIKQDEKGQRFIEVEHEDGKKLLPFEAFRETGEGYYLPTYKDSPLGAAIGGGAKTLLTFGPIAALSASASGFAAHKFSDKPVAKYAIGAGMGAALFAATNAIFKNPIAAGASALLGASAGVLGVHAGMGKAAIRDAAYSGGLASFGTLPVSEDPMLGLHSAAAAGIGASAKSAELKALISGASGAALGAAHAALSGGSMGTFAALTATTSIAGALAGPSVMQASRNISHSTGEVIGKVLRKAPDPVLKVVGTVPVAAGMGFLGAAAGLIVPGAGALGAIFGTIGGVALGASQTNSKLEAAKDEATAPQEQSLPREPDIDN